jgi:hypothetical protein
VRSRGLHNHCLGYGMGIVAEFTDDFVLDKLLLQTGMATLVHDTTEFPETCTKMTKDIGSGVYASCANTWTRLINAIVCWDMCTSWI